MENRLKIRDLVDGLDVYARLFINTNEYRMIQAPAVDKEAVIVDFVNYIGGRCCVDVGMYTTDLKTEVDCKTTAMSKTNLAEKHKIIGMIDQYKVYYSPSTLESVIRRRHMNETGGHVDISQECAQELLNQFVLFIQNSVLSEA